MNARLRSLIIGSAVLALCACRPLTAGVLFDDPRRDLTNDTLTVSADVQGLPYASLKDEPTEASKRGLEIQQTEAGFTMALPSIDVGANTMLRQQFRFDSVFLSYHESTSIHSQEIKNL